MYIYISYIHICFGSRACPNDLVQRQPSERSITMKSQKGHSRWHVPSGLQSEVLPFLNLHPSFFDVGVEPPELIYQLIVLPFKNTSSSGFSLALWSPCFSLRPTCRQEPLEDCFQRGQPQIRLVNKRMTHVWKRAADTVFTSPMFAGTWCLA